MTIMLVILGILGGVASGIHKAYAEQRSRTEALDNANIAMDTMLRLIRMSGNNINGSGITPGTAGADGKYHTIRIQSDWNPVDGALTGSLEDVTFSVSNGVLQVQEGANAAVPFVEGIGPLTITYYDSANGLITNPVANNGQIALVKIDLQTETQGATPISLTSMSNVRKN